MLRDSVVDSAFFLGWIGKMMDPPLGAVRHVNQTKGG